MEEDIVFADKVERLGAGFSHQRAVSRLAEQLAGLDGGRKVADHRLEPDVDALAVPAFHGHGDAPIQIACDGTRLEALGFDFSERFANHGFAPVVLALPQKLGYLRFEVGEIEEEVLGISQLGGRAVHFGSRVEQLFRFEHCAALVTLIRAGAVKAAQIAGAFHIAVGQEAVGRRRVPLRAGLFIEMTVFFQGEENGLRNLEVVLGVGGGEQVVGNPRLLEQIEKAAVEPLVHFFHRLALGVGADGDGRAMRIRTGHHEHAIPFQTVVTGTDIARQVRPGDVAHMDGGVGVGPGNGNEDGVGHGELLVKRNSSFCLAGYATTIA